MIGSSTLKPLLVIDMPRSMTTAFTRALSKSTGRSAMHEDLLEDARHNNIAPEKYKTRFTALSRKFPLRKEMATFTAYDTEDVSQTKEKQKQYATMLNALIQHSDAGTILITANPISVFHSLINVFFKSLTASHQTDQLDLEQFLQKLERFSDAAQEITTHNYQALMKIKFELTKNNKNFTIIDKSDIQSDPQRAVEKVMHDLGLEGTVTTEMSPCTLDIRDKVQPPKYYVAYKDKWTDDRDQSRTSLEASPDTQSAQATRDKLIDKIHRKLAEDAMRTAILQSDASQKRKSFSDEKVKKMEESGNAAKRFIGKSISERRLQKMNNAIEPTRQQLKQYFSPHEVEEMENKALKELEHNKKYKFGIHGQLYERSAEYLMDIDRTLANIHRIFDIAESKLKQNCQ